jgi:Protein of unknown function (DUF1348)
VQCHDDQGQWWRSFGNELWEFAPNGLMSCREGSINDRPITASDRRIFGPRLEAGNASSMPQRRRTMPSAHLCAPTGAVRRLNGSVSSTPEPASQGVG